MVCIAAMLGDKTKENLRMMYYSRKFFFFFFFFGFFKHFIHKFKKKHTFTVLKTKKKKQEIKSYISLLKKKYKQLHTSILLSRKTRDYNKKQGST